MSVLIDTNVLHAQHSQPTPCTKRPVRALEILIKRDEEIFVALQNVAEFWNAATRPATNNITASA